MPKTKISLKIHFRAIYKNIAPLVREIQYCKLFTACGRFLRKEKTMNIKENTRVCLKTITDYTICTK